MSEITEQQAADALAQQNIESARQAAEAAEAARQQAAALRGESQ
ncbi:hypothetical protein [Streptomyces sp. NPDC093097]